MRKPDEIALFQRLRDTRTGDRRVGAPYPDKIAADLGMPPNRLRAILNKWTDRDWWEYGVSMRCGWFTEKAPQELQP